VITSEENICGTIITIMKPPLVKQLTNLDTCVERDCNLMLKAL
jgi:hypothetical protein